AAKADPPPATTRRITLRWAGRTHSRQVCIGGQDPDPQMMRAGEDPMIHDTGDDGFRGGSRSRS
ncbi:MAG TPA: hypothetical protein VJQ61_12960, partial [Sinomonas sp.]|nr:hypothetical protein [Sinomonas sp.]